MSDTPAADDGYAEVAQKVAEIVRLLDEAYDHYFDTSDGYCKMSEGAVRVHFGNYFERKDGEVSLGVSVYSYVLGPSRDHHFDTVDEALETVQKWHADEMADNHADVWGEPNGEGSQFDRERAG